MCHTAQFLTPVSLRRQNFAHQSSIESKDVALVNSGTPEFERFCGCLCLEPVFLSCAARNALPVRFQAECAVHPGRMMASTEAQPVQRSNRVRGSKKHNTYVVGDPNGP